jgi:F0F1-type ATP synthase delta subunit
LPNGRKHWPSFPGSKWLPIAPVRQFQLVQHDLHSIEVRFVADDALTQEQEQRLIAMLQKSFGYPFRITFVRKEKIEPGANFKYEDFISEVVP